MVTQDISEDGDLSIKFEDIQPVVIELPPCELSKLDSIFELVTSAIPSAVQRESLAIAMEKESYIAKLLDLFHMCEDLENLDGLQHLYNIFRTLFLLNKTSLLQMMFHEDTIMDVVGCLEYSPARSRPVRHRDYLLKISQHKEVIPFNNPQLLAKIHQTYKMQYIQEVILPTPSLFEEHMMSALNSLIMFNKSEIINSLEVLAQVVVFSPMLHIHVALFPGPYHAPANKARLHNGGGGGGGGGGGEGTVIRITCSVEKVDHVCNGNQCKLTLALGEGEGRRNHSLVK